MLSSSTLSRWGLRLGVIVVLVLAATLANSGRSHTGCVALGQEQCVSQQAPPTKCKCTDQNGKTFTATANCTITVNPINSKKCGGPYCDSCVTACNKAGGTYSSASPSPRMRRKFATISFALHHISYAVNAI